MASWEIRLDGHPSIVCETEDSRDLAAEFQRHLKRKPNRKAERFWQPIEGVAVDSQRVIAVQRRLNRRTSRKDPVGFSNDSR
jgi:hypothetical protein